MNAKDVLKKIVTMLSSDEVTFTDAQTTDGAILQSPTFDLGESVDVVSEDGTKTPAPDGEHEIALKDSEGKEVIIRIVTKDGKITERENVEEAQPEVPEAGEAPEEEMASVAGEDIGGEPAATSVDEEAGIIPANDDKEEMTKAIQDMAFRISELEKKFEDMTAEEVKTKPLPGDKTEMAADDEEELPKLDGAPIDEHAQRPNNVSFGKKVGSAQNTFLSKLYK
jgi:hypothetical protein